MAIAGYTNAGKSSLMNRLTEAGIMVEDALFATLDPTVRRAETSEGRTYTLTDTVGFVRNLPHELIEAFRSTLEEVAGADLVLHVVDAAHPDPLSQVAAVRTVRSTPRVRSTPSTTLRPGPASWPASVPPWRPRSRAPPPAPPPARDRDPNRAGPVGPA